MFNINGKNKKMNCFCNYHNHNHNEPYYTYRRIL